MDLGSNCSVFGTYRIRGLACAECDRSAGLVESGDIFERGASRGESSGVGFMA